MTTLFEQQGGQYELQGDYRLPCVTLPNENGYEIGVWGERHRRYLKEQHKDGYYNLLTAGTLDNKSVDCALEFVNYKLMFILSEQTVFAPAAPKRYSLGIP